MQNTGMRVKRQGLPVRPPSALLGQTGRPREASGACCKRGGKGTLRPFSASLSAQSLFKCYFRNRLFA